MPSQRLPSLDDVAELARRGVLDDSLLAGSALFELGDDDLRGAPDTAATPNDQSAPAVPNGVASVPAAGDSRRRAGRVRRPRTA